MTRTVESEPRMKRFDVTFCPQYPGATPMMIEVDAVGEEEACEYARWYFSTIYRQHVTVTTITDHKPQRPRPISFITAKLSNMG